MNIKEVPTFESINYSGQVELYKDYDMSSLSFIDGASIQCGFAWRINNEKYNGTYVEIGAGHFEKNNNTYLLEKLFNWAGVAIDSQKHFCDLYNENRKNFCICEDAITYNFENYFIKNNFPTQIDYLQIDIDHNPTFANVLALINLPLTRYRFTTISIEHDTRLNYKFSNIRDTQREILSNLDYRLVYPGKCEDLWVDSRQIPNIMETIMITNKDLGL